MHNNHLVVEAAVAAHPALPEQVATVVPVSSSSPTQHKYSKNLQ